MTTDKAIRPEQSESTPRPWRLEYHPSQKGEPATLVVQDGAEMWEKWIAECPCGQDTDPDSGDGDGVRDCTALEAQANAALIVRAVNSHSDLLAACEAWSAFLEWLDGGIELGMSSGARLIELRTLTNDALAKAEHGA